MGYHEPQPAPFLTGYTDTSNNQPIMGTWTFQYDSLNRLFSASSSAGPYASSANLTFADNYLPKAHN